MEDINYASGGSNMVLPVDAQIVQGVSGNAVYFPAGSGITKVYDNRNELSISLWRKWDGAVDTEEYRGVYETANIKVYFDQKTDLLTVELAGVKTITDIKDDQEQAHWCFLFLRNNFFKIYKNAEIMAELPAGDYPLDFSAGFKLGGGRTHATFDEVRMYKTIVTEPEINGLYRLITRGTPVQHLKRIVSSVTPKYLGVTQTVSATQTVFIMKGETLGAVTANPGDWVLMSKTVGGWKTGVCYRWSGVMWINLEPEYNYEAQYQACLSHIFEIPELTKDTGHYGALFAKLIAAQEAFIEKLVTSEAFINKLATSEAFIDRLITKRLLVDSDTANPNNFELAINEGVGILAKKDGKRVFEINANGESFFSGSIESGPLLLSLKSPGEQNFSFTNQTRIYTICKAISEKINGTGLFYCSGTYGDKKLKAVSVYWKYNKTSFDNFSGKYFKGKYGIWQAVYRKVWRGDFIGEQGIIKFIFTDGTEEQIEEQRTAGTFTHIKDELVRKNTWEIYPGEASVNDPSNFSSGEVRITEALNVSINADSYTLLWKNLPLGNNPNYISGTVYRDNEGQLYVVP